MFSHHFSLPTSGLQAVNPRVKAAANKVAINVRDNIGFPFYLLSLVDQTAME
jgi:hypothetical protein